MTLAAHPATDLFPMMDDAALRELADDIAAHGLQYPVVLHEGMILDGRNRVAACELIGQPAEYVPWDQNGISPTEWVVATNLHRRHLTIAQRAAIAVEMLPLLEAEARERQGGSGRFGSGSLDPEPETHQGRSNEQAAASVGVSAPTVKRMKRLKEQAPEMYEQVKAGSKTVTTAHREAFTATRPRTNGRMPLPPPKRSAPQWRRHFTSWCRGVLPEDKPHLLAMSAELHTALGHLGLTCTEGEK
jgi:hypothetical protein